jgi:hypothetical protein
MSDYKRQQPQDCPPAKDPAPQPNPPGGSCQPLPPSTPPTVPTPKPCPDPDPCCKCPTTPGSDPTCFERFINSQTDAIAAGKKAETFKAELVQFQAKAKTANQEYTRDKFDALVKLWVDLDADIAKFIAKFVCNVSCWRCIIDCYVCPLLNTLHYAEEWLNGDGTPYANVNNWYDLQYWYSRDKDAKERTFNRIKDVLKAWEKPAATIEAILKQNRGLLDALDKSPSSDKGKVVYDLFLKLIPLHLAIAPPSGSAWTTKIGKEYTEFCGCDSGTPDDCCGPDVGVRSLRERVTGPQPYLVDPNDYFKIICCLVENRYLPAKDALSDAENKLSAAAATIKGYTDQITNGLATFERDAKGAIPGVFDCCDYECDDDSQSKPSQAR